MKKILVIEDDFAIQSLTVKALQSRGFRTLTAPDGLAGLEVARQQLPDLIVCDIQMPRMNGIELCRALRADERTSRLPVIMLTAKGFEFDHDEMKRELGISEIMLKPFSPRELLKTVEELLAGGRTARVAN